MGHTFPTESIFNFIDNIRPTTLGFDGAIILLVNMIKSHLRKLVFWFLKIKESFIKIFINIWKHDFNYH